MIRVGVRELRRNLSAYLRRVQRGEQFEVTEHGRPVAVLGPIGRSTSPIQRLVAAGRILPPAGNLLGLLPPEGRSSTRGSDALIDGRAERL